MNWALRIALVPLARVTPVLHYTHHGTSQLKLDEFAQTNSGRGLKKFHTHLQFEPNASQTFTKVLEIEVSMVNFKIFILNVIENKLS